MDFLVSFRAFCGLVAGFLARTGGARSGACSPAPGSSGPGLGNWLTALATLAGGASFTPVTRHRYGKTATVQASAVTCRSSRRLALLITR
jgi:hypothetical protein